MGNQQAQESQILNQFDLDEIVGTQSQEMEKKNILIDNCKGELVYYLVTEKSVEKILNQVNPKIKSPYFSIGQQSPPITHSLLIKSNQRSAHYQQDIQNKGVLIILIFSDSKLAVLSGEELQLLKTIQLFAPLEAFKISFIYELQFLIKEDTLHKQKQSELIEELMQQRQDFQEVYSIKLESMKKEAINESQQNKKDIQQEEKKEEVQENPQEVQDNPQGVQDNTQEVHDKNKDQEDQKEEKSENQEEKSEKQEEQSQKKEEVIEKQNDSKVQEQSQEQEIRNPSKSASNNQWTNEQQQKYDEFLKAQYEIFVQASKMVTNELLDIQGICYSSKSVILVGYKCGLIQKVTVEKNLIEIEEECVFFNPLNLKPKSEIEKIIQQNQGEEGIGWSKFNILLLHSLFCVYSTYVISVNQSPIESEDKTKTSYQTLVYVFEYQHGKKVSYFEATSHKIIKTFVNPHEITNKSILFILDESNALSLYNFEKGQYIQSFNLEKSMSFIDVNYQFYRKDQMFSQISDTYKILENVAKVQDKTIDGDIFLYFTADCRTLITQLDYKAISQAIPSSQAAGQKQQVKKALNQRALKILSSKIPCNYKMSVYYPELDILFIAGEKGQLLRFKNFLTSIYYFL